MKQPIDRVSQAYFDELGTEFGEKVRERIHWICENSIGETILDVGCSQGITSILLGREGKSVKGMDLLEESISYANNLLENEANSTKKYVEFEIANFIDYDFGDKKYDTIIFGEIIEHITDPKRFLTKAFELLENNGQIIVTVPFGINDYFDHKKTYYLQGLLDLQSKNLKVTKVKFLGKWIGAIFVKDSAHNGSPIGIDNKLLRELEENFHSIEKEERHKRLGVSQETSNSTSNRLENPVNKNAEQALHSVRNLNVDTAPLNKNEQQIEEFKSQLAKYEEELKKVTEQKTSEQKRYKTLEKSYQQKLKQAHQKYVKEKQKKLKSEEELLGAYEKEERLLKNHSYLLKRYEALKTSKLGKITRKYWKLRRKWFGGRTRES